MNNILSLAQAACTFADPDPAWCADEMLSELLVSHDEMIMQLRFEWLEIGGSVDCPTGVIDQHVPSPPPAKPVPTRQKLLSGGLTKAPAV